MIYLFRRDIRDESTRGPAGISAGLVSGSDEAAARTALDATLRASGQLGSVYRPEDWTATSLGAGSLPPAFEGSIVQGELVATGEPFRGA